MASEESNSSTQPSKSGITTDEHGIRHIPSSVRADGSVRKEIKIRPGYRPPEDVEVYRNRTADAWKNRGSGGVLGADTVNESTEANAASTSSNKNAKRREARRKAAAAKAEAGGVEVKQDAEEKTEKDPAAEQEKQAKKLAKRLRQARELKDKKDSGAALLPEQFEKVIRINELIRQLDALGFDSNGEKKEGGAT